LNLKGGPQAALFFLLLKAQTRLLIDQVSYAALAENPRCRTRFIALEHERLFPNLTIVISSSD
jgi:hypothetical protein